MEDLETDPLVKHGPLGRAAIAQRIHLELPSSSPGFESQAHHLLPLIVKFCTKGTKGRK